jgi:hypothetical protein
MASALDVRLCWLAGWLGCGSGRGLAKARLTAGSRNPADHMHVIADSIRMDLVRGERVTP